MRPKRSWCKKSRCFRVQWLCLRGAELAERGRRWAAHGPVITVSRPELTIQTARLHSRAVRKVLTRYLRCGVGSRCGTSIYGVFLLFLHLRWYMSC
jgi:hypothetical protein